MLALRVSLSEYLMDGWRYTSKTTFCPLTYSTIGKTAICANVLLLPFILVPDLSHQWYRLMELGYFLQEIHLSQTPWQMRPCLFFVGTHLHLPVSMAVGPVGGGGRTSFMSTLLLSATRIIWLKKFRSAFRTTSWLFIRDVFVLIVENVFSLCIVILSWNYTVGG